MSDIVQRLRAWSPLIASGLEVPAASLAMDEAAAEIERLRARIEVLEQVSAAAQAWREDMTMPTDPVRSGVINRRLMNALARAKP